MKARKNYLSAVMIALIAMLVPATLVLAGGDPPTPPDWTKVTGPEIWGTAVVRCDPDSDNFIAIRVKRIKDCNVQTDGLVLMNPVRLATGCPEDSAPFLYERLLPGAIFSGDPDVPQTSEPIVTKIKNFTVHSRHANNTPAVLSFDAQIKFEAP